MKKLNRFLVFIVCSMLLCIIFIDVYAKSNNNCMNSFKYVSKCTNSELNKSSIANISSKVETVYGILSKNGNVNKVYVVNEFNFLNNGTIYDYGNYSEVKSLSKNALLNTENNINKITATKGKVYYQGDLVNKNLPWNIDIKYYLNKEKISPDELAGKSGKLKIITNITKNKNFNMTFYNNYLLQITFSLDTNHCSNIVADTSTIANAGRVKKVNFTSMPGKDSTFELVTEVENFEMVGVDFSGIPLNINIDLPDMNIIKDKLNILSTSICQLNDGAINLKSGSNTLNNTLNTLSKGSDNINNGMQKLSLGMLDIKEGSNKIYEALTQFEDGINNFDNNVNMNMFISLTKSLKNIVAVLKQIETQLILLQENYEDAYTMLNNAVDKIPKKLITKDKLKSFINKNDEQLNILLDYYSSGLEIKDIYDNVKPVLKSVKDNLPIFTKSIGDIILAAEKSINEINKKTLDDKNNNINVLYEKLHELVVQYKLYNDNIIMFSGYIDNVDISYKKFNNGINSLSKGYKTFDENVEKFSSGLGELNNNTKNLPQQVEGELKSFVDNVSNGTFEPSSFVSVKNNSKIRFVQFLFKTEPIKNNCVIEDNIIHVKNKTIVDRILDLFR